MAVQQASSSFAAIQPNRATRPHTSSSTNVAGPRSTPTPWALPGGVIDPGETPRAAAFREAAEEANLPRDCTSGPGPLVVVWGEVPAYDHGTWKYTVVFADVTRDWIPQRQPGDWETSAVCWVPVDDVAGYNLLPHFGLQWPSLLVTIRRPHMATQSNINAHMPQKNPTTSGATVPTAGGGTNSTTGGTTDAPATAPELGAKRPSQDDIPAPTLPDADLVERRYQADLRVRRNITRIKGQQHRDRRRNQGGGQIPAGRVQ